MASRSDLNKYRSSYNYCGICDYSPQSNEDELNYAPIQWWDPDDGWKIGKLCSECFLEYKDVQPDPEDYANRRVYEYPDDSGTDEDPCIALENDM